MAFPSNFRGGILDLVAELCAEQSLRTEHQHEEQSGECHAAAGAAAHHHQGEDLDEAQQVAADHRSRYAAHPAQHDHGEAANLDVVAADVPADVAPGAPPPPAPQTPPPPPTHQP